MVRTVFVWSITSLNSCRYFWWSSNIFQLLQTHKHNVSGYLCFFVIENCFACFSVLFASLIGSFWTFYVAVQCSQSSVSWLLLNVTEFCAVVSLLRYDSLECACINDGSMSHVYQMSAKPLWLSYKYNCNTFLHLIMILSANVTIFWRNTTGQFIYGVRI